MKVPVHVDQPPPLRQMAQNSYSSQLICCQTFIIEIFPEILIFTIKSQDAGESEKSTVNKLGDVGHHVRYAAECFDFIVGIAYNNTFRSPGFPGSYFNGLDCVKIIKAPGPNYAIVLDFKKRFQLETDNRGGRCSYDFLEVRDGPYGFSPLLGIYCGEKFPERVIARSGAMWVRFKTDTMLHYAGFEAFYTFELLEESPVISSHNKHFTCNITEMGDDGHISAVIGRKLYNYFDNSSFDTDLDCIWKVQTQRPGFYIRLVFKKFKLAFPNNCNTNFLAIYSSNTAGSRQIRKYCGLTASNLAVLSNVAIIRLYLQKDAVPSTEIEIIYSVYTTGSNGVDCADDHPDFYRCQDATCIPVSTVCNGISNCLYNDDEKGCIVDPGSRLHFSTGPYLIILVVVGVIIAGIVTLALVLNLCPRFQQAYVVTIDHGRRSMRRMVGSIRGERRKSSITKNQSLPVPMSNGKDQIGEGDKYPAHYVTVSANNRAKNEPRNNRYKDLHIRSPLVPVSVEHAHTSDTSPNSHSYLQQKGTTINGCEIASFDPYYGRRFPYHDRVNSSSTDYRDGADAAVNYVVGSSLASSDGGTSTNVRAGISPAKGNERNGRRMPMSADELANSRPQPFQNHSYVVADFGSPQPKPDLVLSGYPRPHPGLEDRRINRPFSSYQRPHIGAKKTVSFSDYSSDLTSSSAFTSGPASDHASVRRSPKDQDSRKTNSGGRGRLKNKPTNQLTSHNLDDVFGEAATSTTCHSSASPDLTVLCQSNKFPANQRQPIDKSQLSAVSHQQKTKRNSKMEGSLEYSLHQLSLEDINRVDSLNSISSLENPNLVSLPPTAMDFSQSMNGLDPSAIEPRLAYEKKHKTLVRKLSNGEKNGEKQWYTVTI